MKQRSWAFKLEVLEPDPSGVSEKNWSFEGQKTNVGTREEKERRRVALRNGGALSFETSVSAVQQRIQFEENKVQRIELELLSFLSE